MRLGARAIIGHLVWGRDGSVWAFYLVEPIGYLYRSRREKLRLHAQVRATLMALSEESRLLSVCRIIDPVAVVERVADGVDLEAHPAWVELTQHAFDVVSRQALFERRNYLAVRLPQVAGGGWRQALSTTLSSVTDGLLAPSPVTADDVQARRRQASAIEVKLGSGIGLRPATATELHWLYARVLRRGTLEPDLDETVELRDGAEPGAVGHVSAPSLAHLGDALVKEGGSASDPDRPRHRRYLRVENDHGVAYHAYLAVAGLPRQFLFPGGAGEWFHYLDAFPFPVDWYACVNAVPNQLAQAKARKQQRELVSQVGEYESEPSGPPSSLADAHDDVDAERAELSANPTTPELQTTIVFSVAASSLAAVEEAAGRLQAVYEPNEYALARPTGGQAALAAAALPGNPLPPVAKDYTQFLLPRDLAAGMPFTGAGLGDPRGMLLGHTLDGGTFQPVLIDPAWGPATNRSGSVGIFGGLGYGKSQTAKIMAYGALARGYQVVIVDRTVMGEYVRFSEVTPGTTQVVLLDASAKVSVDPMRVFRGAERARRTISFLTLLTGTSPTELEGMELAKAVREAAEDPAAGMRAVLDALARRANDEHARVVLRKVEGFAEGDTAHLVFGDADPVTLDADCIVFHTPGLNLPAKHQLESEYLAKRMLPEQVFSQAMLYLVAAVSRSVIFTDRERFGVQLLDEASFLLASPQGMDLVLEGIRDGRKHNAAIWIMSQHPNDLLDDRLSDLLGVKMAFRQPRGAAGAALRFMEVDDQDQATLELVTTELDTGQCLLRDLEGRVGLVQVLNARDELRESFSTQPTTAAPARTRPDGRRLMAAGGGRA